MSKVILTFALCAASLLAQYKSESAGAPPPELAPDIAAAMQKEGTKIVGQDGKVFCEIWMRSTLPSGPKSSEESITLPAVPHGAALGAIRFPGQGSERRGQSLKPGVYVLRFSYYPVDGSHQGVAPQRDFLILTPAAVDKDLNATPAFDALMDLSRKASGTPHPACLSFWKIDADFKPGFEKAGEEDWVLQTKIGDTQVGVILIGVYRG